MPVFPSCANTSISFKVVTLPQIIETDTTEQQHYCLFKYHSKECLPLHELHNW